MFFVLRNPSLCSRGNTESIASLNLTSRSSSFSFKWRKQTVEKKKRFEDRALAMKRAIHRQYGNNRHCHGVALFVDAAWFNVSMGLIDPLRPCESNSRSHGIVSYCIRYSWCTWIYKSRFTLLRAYAAEIAGRKPIKADPWPLHGRATKLRNTRRRVNAAPYCRARDFNSVLRAVSYQLELGMLLVVRIVYRIVHRVRSIAIILPAGILHGRGTVNSEGRWPFRRSEQRDKIIDARNDSRDCEFAGTEDILFFLILVYFLYIKSHILNLA